MVVVPRYGAIATRTTAQDGKRDMTAFDADPATATLRARDA